MYWPDLVSPTLGAYRMAAQAELQAVDATERAVDADVAVLDLEVRLDRMALISEALWTLLRDRVGISESELMDRIRELDMTDGALDGRIRQKATTCPKCRRSVAVRNVACIYCGTRLGTPPFPA